MSAAAKKLINKPDDCVVEALQGLVASSPDLQLLDGLPRRKVVYRAELEKSKSSQVAIITGGGSGHEPAHVGYVGEGMLSAVVCGDVFASPPASAVLAAIRKVTGESGCLLVVKNYTGDRLNFGLAAEQARCEGYKVATVVVGDDCAVSGGIAGRRGLAGTMFVHKVAGAMAARGDDLATVETVAKQVADRVGTIGVALNVCNLPGVKKPSTRLADDEIEIGLGIHGEAGFEVTKIMPAAPLVRQVIEMIATSGRCYLKKGKEVVLMVNNLGSSTSIELNIVANEACEVLTQEYGIELKAVYVGTFITALDMGGVSLTIFKVTPDMLDLLKHPTKARAWTNEFPEYVARRTLGSLPSSKSMLKDPVRPSVLTPLGSQIEKSILGATAQLIVHEQELTEWDTIVGDGDSGSTMRRGAEQIRSDMLANYPLNNPAGVAQCLAKSITHSTGGTSGALYAIFFTAAAAVLNDLEDQASPAAQDWYWALEAGVETIEQYGGATKGCRTMLDAMIPTTEALKEGISRSEDAVQLLRRAVEAAQDGANATQFMVATAGRSSYVPGKFMELVPDPGAKAFQFWLEGVLAAFE